MTPTENNDEYLPQKALSMANKSTSLQIENRKKADSFLHSQDNVKEEISELLRKRQEEAEAVYLSMMEKAWEEANAILQSHITATMKKWEASQIEEKQKSDKAETSEPANAANQIVSLNSQKEEIHARDKALIEENLQYLKIPYVCRKELSAGGYTAKFDFGVDIHGTQALIEYDDVDILYNSSEDHVQNTIKIRKAKDRFSEQLQIPLLRIRNDQISETRKLIRELVRNPKQFIKQHNPYYSNKTYYMSNSYGEE